MKKLIIVLFLFSAIYLMSAINENIRPKSSWSYVSEANKILDSYNYYTSDNTTFSGGAVVDKESLDPITGSLVEYNYSHQVQSIKNYKNGILDGRRYDYYSDGSISKITEYKKGEKDGEELQFFSSGSPYIISEYKNSLLNGTRYEFDDKGYRVLFTEYINGKKEGEEIKFSENVIIQKSIYRNGRLNGKSIFYFSDGTIKAEGEYKDNFREKEWVWYYPVSEGKNIKKIVETYSNGKIREIKGMYPDGSKERSMVLTNGNGVFEQYYRNGSIKLKGNVRNYAADGTWTAYDLRGVPTARSSFNLGNFLY